MITAKYLRSILKYEPASGEFRWKWRADHSVQTNGRFAGKLTGAGSTTRYGVIRIDDVLYRTHRLAWLYMTGEWPSHDIDHRDLDRSNNRWSNLRLATKSTNGANRKRQKNNQSGYKGVFWSTAASKWTAQIAVKGRSKHLGLFADPESAHAAYAAAAKEHFGEFARAA